MTCASVLGLTGFFAIQAEAQQPDQGEGALEEITVTGSRIVRRDYQSLSPIVTVENEDFESRTGLNVESYLNQLPTFNPAATPTGGANMDVQATSINSVGISSVSLRGFGPNRNLVLVDGKRQVPINALMVTDINSIPSAMIERVEIITGGASAVYGADAVGGVTNFILRDDFEGFEFDVQTGISEAGDGEESRMTAIVGTNFDDGRGNVTFSAEYYDRAAALEREREFFRDGWSDPTTASDDLFVYGHNGYNTGFNPPSTETLDTIFADSPDGTNVFADGSDGFVQAPLRFNQDSTLFSVQGNHVTQFNGQIDGQEYALQRTYDSTVPENDQEINQLKWNNQDAYASSPQERYSLFGSASYDVSDNVSFYARGTWTENETRTLLLPANASFGWEASIPYDPETDSPVDPSLDYNDQDVVEDVLANPDAFSNPEFEPTGQPDAQHPVPTEMAVLLNSRAAPGPWIAETYPLDSFGHRRTTNTNTVWQIESGLDIQFGDNWTGEFHISHGESSTYNVANGNLSLARWREAVTSADYGRNTTFAGNLDGAQPGFGAAEVSCESGFYSMLFEGDAAPSEGCQFAVEAPLQSRTGHEQDIAEFNVEGSLAEMPAGQLRAAAGLQYRRNGATYTPDLLQSTRSFEDQVVGVYPTAYMDAETSVRDSYGELLVPITDRFELELGARYSDYEHTGSEWTYKTLLNIRATDWMRFRGGYNRATRAPNLGELFLNRQEVFAGAANFTDPCGLRSTAPFGAGGADDDPNPTPDEPPTQLASGQTEEGAMSAYLICQAQMDAAGESQYYMDAEAGAPGFNWILQEGNENLDSETADTYTLGMVVQSPFDSPWLQGLSASVDYWRYEISDAIQQFSVDYARYLCYGTTTVENMAQAEEQANSPACNNVPRTPGTGGPATALLQYDNLASIDTSGVDIAVNWGAPLADLGFENLPGSLGLNVQASWLDYYKTEASPADFDVETDWKGSLGPTLAGTNGGAYDYRVFTTMSWSTADFSVSLRWQHLPEVWSAGYASQQAIIENNQRVAAGESGIPLSYTPTTEVQTDSYNVFDLSFNWNVTESMSLRGGIDNLFDTEPAITGESRGYPAGTDLSAVCSSAEEAQGCQNPQSFSIPSSGAGTTNGGYYDVLGRRAFVGLQVRF